MRLAHAGKQRPLSTAAASPSSALADDIVAFRHYLQAERGMAANTVLAYGRDLDRFAGWVAGGGLEDYLQPTVRALSYYLSHLREEGLAPASTARHLIALKMFYRFLRMEERASPSAVELLSSPTLWERIPQVLSPESVEKLLSAPQASDRFYLRDRALLETLYSAGLRVSELTGLDIGDLDLDSGLATVRPSGTRRLYAVNSGPLQEVDLWLDRFRRFWTPHLEALVTELDRGRRERRLSASQPEERGSS